MCDAAGGSPRARVPDIMPESAESGTVSRSSLLIAEPLALVREGFVALCESCCRTSVVAQCGDGETTLSEMEKCRPDLALLDQSLDRLFTLEVIRKARVAGLPTRIVVMGMRTDRKTVFETLRSGAIAYVLKRGPLEHLKAAFDLALDGSVYITPLLNLEKMFVASKKADAADPLDRLSSREYEVFMLLVEGIRAKEIAARLDLSPKTVDTYRASLMRKLDIHDVAGLVKFAIHNQLTSAM